MTEKEVAAVAEYEYSDEEFDSIDHEIAIEETDDEYNDKPCISTCCCCCNLGLGSIMAGVIFMVSFFIARQTTGPSPRPVWQKWQIEHVPTSSLPSATRSII